MSKNKQDFILEQTTEGISNYQPAVEQIQEQLTKYGLTPNQSRVYVFLGKHGSMTAPEVCKALKLPRTETYHLLTSLQNKGIVAATFQHPIKFKALPLDRAVWTLVNAEKERVKILETQEDTLTKLWNEIPNFQEIREEPSNEKFQMLQGINQVHSKISEMINTAKKEFLIFGSEKDISKLYHAEFISKLNNSNLELKLLTSAEATSYVLSDIDVDKIKILEKSKESLFFILKDDDELIFFMKKPEGHSNNVSVMWTDSKKMSFAMKLLFESEWSKSKKLLH